MPDDPAIAHTLTDALKAFADLGYVRPADSTR